MSDSCSCRSRTRHLRGPARSWIYCSSQAPRITRRWFLSRSGSRCGRSSRAASSSRCRRGRHRLLSTRPRPCGWSRWSRRRTHRRGRRHQSAPRIRPWLWQPSREDTRMALMVNDLAAVQARVLSRVETRLAEQLASRERTRLRVEDQRWVYELVGQAVAEEQLSNPAAVHDDWELMWRTVFAAVTPLGPLAEHLADPDVEEVRINGTESCFVFRDGRRIAVPPPFADEAGLVELVHWYTDGAAGGGPRPPRPAGAMTLPPGGRPPPAPPPPAPPPARPAPRPPPAP